MNDTGQTSDHLDGADPSARATYRGNSFNRPRPLAISLMRGLRCRCPACGDGRLFGRYLKLTDLCMSCGEALHHARPDDAPPYFVMLITGHIVVTAALAIEEACSPPLWMTATFLSVLTCILSLALLPPVKGIIVAIQWANWMHGFDPHEQVETSSPSVAFATPSRVPPACCGASLAIATPRTGLSAERDVHSATGQPNAL